MSAEEGAAMDTAVMRTIQMSCSAGAEGKRMIRGSVKSVRAGRKEGSGRSFWKISTAGINIRLHFMTQSALLPVAGDGRVSKVHCVIIHRGDKLYLKDEGSRNGTYLNGERLEGPVVIQRDDIIGVGETRFEIQRILRESE